MPYCTLSDVQGVLSAVNIQINSTSKITDSQVNTEIIPMYDQYINDRLGRYYQTPITGNNSLVTMNRIEKYLVAAEVVQRYYTGQTPSDSPAGQTWRTFAEADLTRIIQGEILLTDAVITGESPDPKVNLIADNLSQPTNTQGPLFSVGKVF